MPYWKLPRVGRAKFVHYCIAVLLVLAAVLLRIFIVKQPPALPFILAVMMSAWYGGIGPGVLVTLLAAVSSWMLTPAHSPNSLVEAVLGMGLFLVLSLPIKRIYDGHLKTADAVLALARRLEDRDRKLMISEENLGNETTKLKAILNSMGEGVAVADRDGKLLLSNPAAIELLGTLQQEGNLEDRPQAYGLFLPDMRSRYRAAELPLARAIRGELVDNLEIFVRHEKIPDGIWISATARQLRDERGESTGAVAVFRDISAGKRIEEAQIQAKVAAEQSNLAKSEFLSRMSHELRTPLNSILGFAQLLELAELPEEQRGWVEYIVKGGRHLLGLINEVLDFARIEAGRVSFSMEPVRVTDVVPEVLELVRPLAEKLNVLVKVEDPIALERHVLADRQRLTQVLLNLLWNAVKYNHDGGAVSVLAEAQASGRFRIKVTDSGPGITPGDQEKLFAPFERLAADRSGVEGTGLGLALSKGLVEAMGGAIGVESVVGQGSTFWVDLVLVEGPLEEIEQQADSSLRALEASTSPASYTVIYVEDNLSNMRLMENILVGRPKIKLVGAMQGQLGLELIEEHHPNLILLDLHLPLMQGDEVLRRLRQNPRTQSIPVIIISADATPRQIDRLMAAGATRYITKPLDVQKFLELLDQTLAGGVIGAEARPKAPVRLG